MSLMCRGIRGATRADDNTPDAILAATQQILEQLIQHNDLHQEEVAAVFFTSTPDLSAEFPAVAARQIGWTEVALLGSQEIAHTYALTRCIRVLILVNTSKGPDELVHLYLKGTENLRSRGTAW